MWLIGLRKLDSGCDTTLIRADVYTTHAASASGTNLYTASRSNVYATASTQLYATSYTAEAQANCATGTLCATHATRFACGT